MNKDDEEKQQLCREIAKPGYDIVASIPSPRFIKTHFPFSLLSGILDVGCKVIKQRDLSKQISVSMSDLVSVFLKIVYVARNPKDVAVSWFYLNQAIKTQNYVGDFETFWHYFRNDLSKQSFTKMTCKFCISLMKGCKYIISHTISCCFYF